MEIMSSPNDSGDRFAAATEQITLLTNIAARPQPCGEEEVRPPPTILRGEQADEQTKSSRSIRCGCGADRRSHWRVGRCPALGVLQTNTARRRCRE